MKKTLLGLLPFWTPLMPPMGIACLKSYLCAHDLDVTTADANIEPYFKDIYNNYFDTLRQWVPQDKQGNFFSIGQDVLHNHLMAHFRHQPPADAALNPDYTALLKTLVEKTFFIQPTGPQVKELDDILRDFYRRLDTYIMELVEQENPTVVGLSVCSGTLAPSLFAFKIVKERFPHIRTVMGGGIFCDQFAVGTPNLDILLEQTAGHIDHFIIGEGELLFLKLLRDELPENQRIYTFDDIGGQLLDLATVDIPDFRDFQLDKYPYLSGYTSRSCPYQCKFCSDTVMWGAYRRKPAQQIVDELTRLHRQAGYQLFMLSDLLLNPVVNELSETFIRSDTALYWDGCLRAEKHVCDRENTLRWRRGGFYRARLGCESGSPRMLQLMGKRITVEQAKEALSSLAHAGIQTTTYWVLGFPGETEQDFQQTLDVIEEMREDIYEAECRPFYYYPKGQVNSGEWQKTRKAVRLYPENRRDWLMFDTWVLEGEPDRETIYNRVNRFVQHCRNLGIPNPYTMKDIDDADQRWKKLHANAVPSLLELKNKDVYIDECKQVEELCLVDTAPQDDGDFDF